MKLEEFPAPVPEIPVTDISEAAAYYKESLGFNVDWSDAELGLAGVSKGACRLFLASPNFRTVRGNSAPVLIWLNMNSKDEVNELHQLWSSTNANLLSAPESKSWGLHEFTATDPDGNLFRVFYDFGSGDK
ncbi:MAG TPA: VOC family protein [Pyrinomonadaceae bacterium]|nr:VOC family protein [Pyrinomonadaceae bacterium]